jgi:hypothetical protein
MGSIYPGETLGYLNPKAHGEFDNANRPDGCTGIFPKSTRLPSPPFPEKQSLDMGDNLPFSNRWTVEISGFKKKSRQQDDSRRKGTL